MSTGVVAAGAAAVALYVYLKQKGLQDGTTMEPVMPLEASRNAPDHAPSNWSEALYHVKEVLKYMINETLGRWHTIDLFVGLAYLSHREALEYPAADIAARSIPITGQDYSAPERLKLMLELQEARRYMLYCKGLKLRREEMQARFWKEHLGADTLSVIKQQPTAGVLRPAYVLVSDRALRCVVLCIRGTHSMKDLFTSLAGAAKPHHTVDPVSGRLVLGYSHLGMLAAARWLQRQVTPLLRLALEANPGYQLRIVGHSMGGGTAALLTMMLRDGAPQPPPPHQPTFASISSTAPPDAAATPVASDAEGAGASDFAAASSSGDGAAAAAGAADPFRTARCVAIACPCVVTLELAAACREFVTSVVNGTDIVPTFCADTVDRLREDVTRSSWFSEFSRDMRSGVVRALQGGVRGVGTATQWTSRNILQPAVVPFRACYATTTTRRTKRRTGSLATSNSASAAITASGGSLAALCSSPAKSAALTAAEMEEQMLLGAGAGGGAAAMAAAAAAVASIGEGSPCAINAGAGSSGIGCAATGAGCAGGGHMASPASVALLAALTGPGTSPPGLPPLQLPPLAQAMSPLTKAPQGQSHLPAGLGAHQPMQQLGSGGSGLDGTGLDQRAMAEAVQSCMYAVGSAVSARQHHHSHQHGGQPSTSDPAVAKALGLLESLPPELGAAARPTGHPNPLLHHSHPTRHSRSRSRSSDDPFLASAGALASSSGLYGSGSGVAPGGPRAGGDHAVQVMRHPPGLEAVAEERPAGSLIAGGGGTAGAAVLGAGGVSTALAYGSSLRRRLWPWGPGEGGGGGGTPDTSGHGPGSGSAGANNTSPHAVGAGGGGGGTPFADADLASGVVSPSPSLAGGGGATADDGGPMVPPRVAAPDSPGKAKAAAATAAAAAAGGPGGAAGVVAISGASLVGSAALSSTRAIGDWLWRGGGLLFNSCTTPRRPFSVSQPGGGGGGVYGMWAGGGGGAGGSRSMTMGGGGRAAAGQRPLQMDVGEGYDDESDPEEDDEEDDYDETYEEGDDDDEGEDEDEDEDEEEDEEGVARGGGGGGAAGHSGAGALGVGAGSSGAGGSSGDSEQQLQAGITAVVAAVTNQPSLDATDGSQLLQDETTRAAEEVLREVRAADAAAASATASRQDGKQSAAGGGALRRARRGDPRVTSASRADGRTAAGAADGLRSGGRRHMPRAASDAGSLLARGTAAAAAEDGMGGGRGRQTAEGGAGSSAGGRAGGARAAGAANSAEYEARLYRRRLYPAGRILHLFPAAAAAAVAGAGAAAVPKQSAATTAAAAADAAAASTTAADAAAARASVAQAPYRLYEVPDCRAYARVRLCRSMVSDHLIPAYLAALDSVMGQLEEQQKQSARDAWEAEEAGERDREREEREREREGAGGEAGVGLGLGDQAAG